VTAGDELADVNTEAVRGNARRRKAFAVAVRAHNVQLAGSDLSIGAKEAKLDVRRRTWRMERGNNHMFV
jgi:hypothetical protein